MFLVRLTSDDVFLLAGEIQPTREFADIPPVGALVRVMIAGRTRDARVREVIWLARGLGDNPECAAELVLERA